MDPVVSSVDELFGYALLPSPSSVQLTRLFSNLGEKPTLSFFDHPLMPSSIAPTYNSTGSFWYYELTTPTGSLIPTNVAGRDIHILGCTTQRRRLPMYIKKYTDITAYFIVHHDSQSNTDIPISSPLSPFPLYQTDSCAPNVEYLILNNTHFIFTQSAFTQESYLLSFSDPLLSSFIDILPMGNGTLVLTSSSLFYLPSSPSYPSLIQTQGLSASITHIDSSANCDYLLGSAGEISSLNYIVFAWNDESSSTFYVSYNDGVNFTSIFIDIVSPSGSPWIILHSSVSHSYSRFVIAVRDSGGDEIGLLLLYDYKRKIWSNGASLPSSLSSSINGNSLSLEIPVTGAGVVYAYKESSLVQEMYYSADGGVTLFSIPPLPSPLGNSTLLSFDTSLFGSFAILSSNSTSQILLRELADVFVDSSSSPPPSLAAVQVDFDPFGDPRVLSIENQGVKSTSFPLTSSPSSSLSSIPPCPFLHMSTNGTQRHYLDMGENFTLLITVVSAATENAYVSTRDSGGSAVSIGNSDSTLLDFSLSFLGSNPYSPPITFNHLLVVWEHDVSVYTSYSERSRLAIGSTDIRIGAKEYNAQCSFTQFIHRVRVGCPPRRRIEVISPENGETCNKREKRGKEEKGDNGCAIPHYYGQEFKPILMLFDDDTLVNGKIVEADYIIWEAYGRTDYTFSKLVKNQNCLSNPQKRADFPERKREDGTIDMDWGPATYHSCLVPGGDPVKSGGAYQIMNGQTSNSVVLLGGGTYVFRVRVVATDYSYCDLTEDIVIEVYGAPLSLVYSVLIVILTSLVIVIALVISYYYYRHNEKLHAE